MLAAITLGLAALPSAAPAVVVQDTVPYIDCNGAHNDARVTGRMVRRAQGRHGEYRRHPARRGSHAARRSYRGHASVAEARAICTDRRRIAARTTPARRQRLYTLCARAGYR